MSLPFQTYYAKDKPLFYPIGQPIVVPSLVVSTISASEIEVSNGSNAGWGVVNTGVSSITETMLVQSNGDLLHIDVKDNNVNSTIQSFTQGFPANSSNYIMNYNIATPSGQLSTVASIQFLSSIGPATTGGVELQAQDKTSVIVGGESVYSGITTAGDFLLQSFIPPSDALLAHYSDGGLYNSQILFSGGSGGASTITLQSGSGNVAVEVGQPGVALTPGASNAVVLTNGYFDMNNLAMSNVSTINSASTYARNWINPYGGVLAFSTIGNSSTPIPFAQISSIAGHTYQVTVEFASQSQGGASSQFDLTSMGMINNNTGGGGPTGRQIYMDTWTTGQSQGVGYSVSRTGLITALYNGAIQLEVTNQTASGDVQAISIESIVSKDLGIPIASY